MRPAQSGKGGDQVGFAIGRPFLRWARKCGPVATSSGVGIVVDAALMHTDVEVDWGDAHKRLWQYTLRKLGRGREADADQIVQEAPISRSSVQGLGPRQRAGLAPASRQHRQRPGAQPEKAQGLHQRVAARRRAEGAIISPAVAGRCRARQGPLRQADRPAPRPT